MEEEPKQCGSRAHIQLKIWYLGLALDIILVLGDNKMMRVMAIIMRNAAPLKDMIQIQGGSGQIGDRSARGGMVVLLTRAVELRSLPSKLLPSSQAPYHVSVVGGNSPQSTSTCLFRWLGTALPDVNKTKLQMIGKAACAATGFQFCHERPSLPGKHVLNFSILVSLRYSSIPTNLLL